MFNIRNLVVLAAALVPFGAAAPVETAAAPEPVIDTANKYIITLKPGIAAPDLQSHMRWVGDVHRRNMLARRDADPLPGVSDELSIKDFHAYVGTFDEATIEAIRNNPDVADVEADQIYTLDAITSQSGATWGLGSISSHNSGSTTYRYDSSAGAGGFVYVVDSGVRETHNEFGGRVVKGTNMAGGAHTDTLGHGTHVAGTAAGATYGVAKAATIVDVKVFTGRSAATSVIMSGLSWAANDIVAKGRQSRAVINMSLGGPLSNAFDAAVNSAQSSGIFVAVASGNSNVQAVTNSPQRASGAFVVGAINSSWREASFSNYGSIVKVLAPGEGITSAWYTSNSATNTIDGTSMASPHIAGLAVYLAVLEGISSPTALGNRIVALSTTGKASGLKSGTPNRIAYNGNA
ncbi:hypothetical protein RB601_006826 [Gaeumannomyces tritici]